MLTALALSAAGDHDEAADALLGQAEASGATDDYWRIIDGPTSLPRKQMAAARLLEHGRGRMKDNQWEAAEQIFLRLTKQEDLNVDASELAREVTERAALLVSIHVPRNAARGYKLAFQLYEAAGDPDSAALALERSAEANVKGFRFADAEARYLELAALWSRRNATARAAAAEKAASDARARQSRR